MPDPASTNAGTSRPVEAHVLFLDIVGFTRMSMERQRTAVAAMQELVLGTEAVKEAEATGAMVIRPTGDGLALAFFGSILQPVRCAHSVSQHVRTSVPIKLRMGIHSGQVFRVTDTQGNPDIIGDGINTAQRVMDCGDPGHILLSSSASDLLGISHEWKEHLHSLGSCAVKHGQVVHLFNLYSRSFGNSNLPKSVRTARRMQSYMAGRSVRAVKVFAGVAATLAVLKLGQSYGPMVVNQVQEWRAPSPQTVLKRSRELMDQKSWQEATTTLKRVLSSQKAKPEERAEAYYLLVSIAYHRGDADQGAKLAEEALASLGELSKDHTFLRAMQVEPRVNRVRQLSAKGSSKGVISAAQELLGGSALATEQRAECMAYLAKAYQALGNKDAAYRIAGRFGNDCKNLGKEHWSRSIIAQVRDATAPPPPGPGAGEFLNKMRAANAQDQRQSILELGTQALAVTGKGKLTPTELAEVRFHLMRARAAGGEYGEALLEASRIGNPRVLEESLRSEHRDLLLDCHLSIASDDAAKSKWSSVSSHASSAYSIAVSPLPDPEDYDAQQRIAQIVALRARALYRLNQSKSALELSSRYLDRFSRFASANGANEWVNEIVQIRDEIRSSINTDTPTPPDDNGGEPDTP